MSLSFNTNGNLHKTVALTFDEFLQHFGTNQSRIKQIETAFLFFKIFHTCGCRTVYIGGSFVSTKRNPADIDLCFDITAVNYEKLKKEFPEFFDFNKLGEIRKRLNCHIFYFDQEITHMLTMLQEDRNGNPKGLVKLSLTEIDKYDQERKTI